MGKILTEDKLNAYATFSADNSKNPYIKGWHRSEQEYYFRQFYQGFSETTIVEYGAENEIKAIACYQVVEEKVIFFQVISKSGNFYVFRSWLKWFKFLGHKTGFINKNATKILWV